MTAPILVTGGTGTLGRLLVPQLRTAGRDVRVLSRHAQPAGDGVEYVTADLNTGAGVDAAVGGVDIIVHCAGGARGDDRKARTVSQAAVGAGVRHLVNISVVGADRVPVVSRVDRAMFGYFAAKSAAERIIAESGVPYTTLRATQFHDLVLTTVKQMTKLVVVPTVSGARFQPVDTGEVATRMAELALGEPAGLVPEMGGPRIYPMDDLIRSYLRATGRRGWLMPVRMPGAAARAIRAGANLAPDNAVGRRTWEEFLAERL